MSSKAVALPKHTTTVNTGAITPAGVPVTEEKNTVLFLINFINENTKHKNDTDDYLCHSIKEKLDAAPTNAKTIELDEAEIDFLVRGIAAQRQEGGLKSSSWYYITAALRDAQPVKRKEKS